MSHSVWVLLLLVLYILMLILLYIYLQQSISTLWYCYFQLTKRISPIPLKFLLPYNHVWRWDFIPWLSGCAAAPLVPSGGHTTRGDSQSSLLCWWNVERVNLEIINQCCDKVSLSMFHLTDTQMLRMPYIINLAICICYTILVVNQC